MKNLKIFPLLIILLFLTSCTTEPASVNSGSAPIKNVHLSGEVTMAAIHR